jgi:hypothetical protein
VLFHHDPWHTDDVLESLEREVWGRWAHLDGEARRVLLFHHDPAHDDDFLDAHGHDASECWARLGCVGRVELGREGDVIDVSE